MALVDNALKFSPKGGVVEIHLRETAEDVLVAVEDHGIGIDKENMRRIFDRFYHLEKHEMIFSAAWGWDSPSHVR